MKLCLQRDFVARVHLQHVTRNFGPLDKYPTPAFPSIPYSQPFLTLSCLPALYNGWRVWGRRRTHFVHFTAQYLQKFHSPTQDVHTTWNSGASAHFAYPAHAVAMRLQRQVILVSVTHCAGMLRACDSRATAGRTPTATSNTTSPARNQQVRSPRLASRLCRPDKTSGQRMLPKDRTAHPTCPPLRPLSLFVSRAVAMTRSPCGHVCSPVLLRRLLLTQSNALQTQEQPQKVAHYSRGSGPSLKLGSTSPYEPTA